MNKDVKAINESYEKIKKWWQDRNWQSNRERAAKFKYPLADHVEELVSLALVDPSNFHLEIKVADEWEDLIDKGYDVKELLSSEHGSFSHSDQYILHSIGKNGEYDEEVNVHDRDEQSALYDAFKKKNPSGIKLTDGGLPALEKE